MRRNLLLLIMTASFFLAAFRSPPGAMRYVEMGDSYFSEGEKELALESYSKAVALEPDNSAYRTIRGFFLLKLQLHDAALQDFSAAVTLEPQNPAGYITRGLVYSDLKREKEADADFATACKLGSRDGCSFAAQK